MRVKLRIAAGQSFEQRADVGLLHPCILQHPKNKPGVSDAEAPEPRPSIGRKATKHHRVQSAISPVARSQPRIQPEWIERQTQALDAQGACVAQENAQDYRVHVEMEMAIDVVKRQAGCAKLFKLSVDFGAQLFAQFTVEKITPAATNRVVVKTALGADQTRNLFRRQSRDR